MKRAPLKIKYPKLLLLLLTFVAAYFLFKGREFPAFYNALLSLGYLGTFLSGMFFAYGFTAAPATAILLVLAEGQNIVMSGIVAGLGALLGDVIIFKIIRHSFADELKDLSNGRAVKYMGHKIPGALKKYLIPVVAGFIIASPLPDEIGVSLLAASSRISIMALSVVSFLLNTAGIFAILGIGKLL